MTEVPTGVKVISVLYYIGAVLGVLFGLIFLLGAGIMGSFLSQIPLLGALGAGLFIVVAVLMIGLSVLTFFVARGLWKARRWARITAIVFACLGILTALSSIIQGQIISSLFGIIVHGAIGGYLLFSSSVKQAFA